MILHSKSPLYTHTDIHMSFACVGNMLMFCYSFILLGVRFTSYHGNFMLRSTDLLALPAVDCDKAFAMQLSLEETLLTIQTVYFQVALLYPSASMFYLSYT